jgi:hypothetical protein
MSNDKSHDKDTVGEVGSSIPGGQNPKPEQDEQVTEQDLKGKKVDADLSEEKDRPAE